MNVASDKNFEKDVRDKVNQIETHGQVTHSSARLGVNLHPCGWKSDYIHVVAESVGQLLVIIFFSLKLLYRLRLQQYQQV